MVNLAFILARLGPENLGDDVRQLAGLVLKLSVANHFKEFPPEIQAYIRSDMLVALGDQQSQAVRHTAGNVVTNLPFFDGRNKVRWAGRSELTV